MNHRGGVVGHDLSHIRCEIAEVTKVRLLYGTEGLQAGSNPAPGDLTYI